MGNGNNDAPDEETPVRIYHNKYGGKTASELTKQLISLLLHDKLIYIARGSLLIIDVFRWHSVYQCSCIFLSCFFTC